MWYFVTIFGKTIGKNILNKNTVIYAQKIPYFAIFKKWLKYSNLWCNNIYPNGQVFYRDRGMYVRLSFLCLIDYLHDARWDHHLQEPIIILILNEFACFCSKCDYIFDLVYAIIWIHMQIGFAHRKCFSSFRKGLLDLVDDLAMNFDGFLVTVGPCAGPKG
jgi:hypothetical protein